MRPELREPWLGFVKELDALLDHEVEPHCRGGFVVTTQYGLEHCAEDVRMRGIAESIGLVPRCSISESLTTPISIGSFWWRWSFSRPDSLNSTLGEY